ncbi:hypothetical protein LOTGIDRAFT_164111 [Lottia gigantea]|uniref:Tyr recombinase domain-containing protein n=1 Tax=Lottia gigantea TaxID=225164 RepID=V4BNR0_LOTGI|nr:hypothetical protein LOTGIDRAFT_164111 [Lottia gigantea]ESO90524.1 hypothetical protein LOTGIDRAFT_164111 [Lottia gigantea]
MANVVTLRFIRNIWNYVQVMKITTDTRWYSKQSMGHNTIQKIVPELFKVAGVSGYKTNHSLRVTTATRLINSGVPEQLIMELPATAVWRGLEFTRGHRMT